jgi:hypothetical protein
MKTRVIMDKVGPHRDSKPLRTSWHLGPGDALRVESPEEALPYCLWFYFCSSPCTRMRVSA